MGEEEGGHLTWEITLLISIICITFVYMILILKFVHNVPDSIKLKILTVKTEYRLHILQREGRKHGGREGVARKEEVGGGGRNQVSF